MLERIEQAARSMDLGSVERVEAPTAESLRALRPAVFSGANAVIVVGSGMFWNYRRDVVALVNTARLPAIYPEREYADDGRLMVYGANVADNFRRAADYVDRILKGTKPGDLPIQEPVKTCGARSEIKRTMGRWSGLPPRGGAPDGTAWQGRGPWSG